MGLLNARTFTYNNVSSEVFGLVIGYFGGTDEEIITGLETELDRGEMNMVRSIPQMYGTTYTETLKIEFDVFHCNGETISFEDSRAINRWLHGSKTFTKLTFNDGIPESIHYYAICTNITDVVAGNGLTGKKLEFQCNAPYGFSTKKSMKIDLNGEDTETTIINQSDEGNYYPTVRLDNTDSGEIQITNVTAGKSFTIDFTNIEQIGEYKTVILDGALCRISDANGKLLPLYKIGWDENTSLSWPELVPGKNKIIISGNGTATITCEFPRKVGLI